MPITNRLRDYAPKLKKHNAVQNFPLKGDKNQENYNFFGDLFFKIENLKPKVGPHIFPMSRVCHNRTF